MVQQQAVETAVAPFAAGTLTFRKNALRPNADGALCTTIAKNTVVFTEKTEDIGSRRNCGARVRTSAVAREIRRPHGNAYTSSSPHSEMRFQSR